MKNIHPEVIQTESPVECHWCGYSLADKAQLEIHMRINHSHTGERFINHKL